MKNILCYGDSNTFGFNPKDGSRYKKDERWTGVLASLLGSEYKVIEAGFNNRTLYFKNASGLMQSGCAYFPKFIENYPSYDWVILALGVNDTQFLYNATEDTFKSGIIDLVNTVRNYCDAKILILGPSVVKKEVLNTFFAEMFDEKSIETSKIISDVYKSVAQQNNCHFIDLNNIAQASDVDGLHYSVESHKQIANILANTIVNN